MTIELTPPPEHQAASRLSLEPLNVQCLVQITSLSTDAQQHLLFKEAHLSPKHVLQTDSADGQHLCACAPRRAARSPRGPVGPRRHLLRARPRPALTGSLFPTAIRLLNEAAATLEVTTQSVNKTFQCDHNLSVWIFTTVFMTFEARVCFCVSSAE